jgi:hypothetical protein
MKTCNKCKVLKPLECFYKGDTYKDGHRAKCIECIKAYQQENKELKKEYLKKYKELNKKNLKLKNKEYRDKNSEKIKTWRIENENYFKSYRIDNRENSRNYVKNRNTVDPIFKFKNNVRRLLLHSFKRGRKNLKKIDKTEIILGCTIEEFVIYISKKFKEGMTLGNHGEWHIDHVIPLVTATTEEEVIKLNHYTNLQPLWAKENFSKGGRYQINY